MVAWSALGDQKQFDSLIPPFSLAVRPGDRCVTLLWEPQSDLPVVGYRVYRATSADGPFTELTRSPLASTSFADVSVTNGQSFLYRIRGADVGCGGRVESQTVEARPKAFAGEDDFLDYLQQTAFDYFWHEANPANGLIRDRSRTNSYCSIAAVGFGLTAICVAIERQWITREQGRARVLATLRTFSEKPQGPQPEGIIGHNGWFYHFLHMKTGLRAWKCELSSIDTALFLAGALYCREYFSASQPAEADIRSLVNAIYWRINWHWMTGESDSHSVRKPTPNPSQEGSSTVGQVPLLGGVRDASLSMGWHPESGFIKRRWIGYNEAMILYLLGLGAATNPLPPEIWSEWTRGYQWNTSYGQSYVHFPPLFGHQYSHCWIDFRGLADDYLRAKGIDYFENSRRATLAQRAYCIANPGDFKGYGELAWGLTACDGPGVGRFHAYSARGAPPPENDDGTIAPTAAGGSIHFAPEVCIPTLRHFYDQYRTNIWTPYGFCDAFNLTANWWDPEVLGIDQGPILIMIENHRTAPRSAEINHAYGTS